MKSEQNYYRKYNGQRPTAKAVFTTAVFLRKKVAVYGHTYGENNGQRPTAKMVFTTAVFLERKSPYTATHTAKEKTRYVINSVTLLINKTMSTIERIKALEFQLTLLRMKLGLNPIVEYYLIPVEERTARDYGILYEIVEKENMGLRKTNAERHKNN